MLLDVDLSISALAPAVTVDTLVTNDSTPELTGMVDDPNAFVQVTVGDYSYIADNNSDGTWTLMDDSITVALTDGAYDVIVTATDLSGNIGSDATAGELVVDTTAPVVDVFNLANIFFCHKHSLSFIYFFQIKRLSHDRRYYFIFDAMDQIFKNLWFKHSAS